MSLRITGGLFRGRMIQSPAGSRTRPTQARLRQALFNSLQHSIPGARVLDLFAGSGALGFEALSRGAERAVFVESARPVVQVIERNARDLKLTEQIEILGDAVERAVQRLVKLGPFDVVLADPPYEEGWEMRLLTELPWAELLVPEGHLCMEWGIKKSQVSELPESIGCLVKIREKNYGDSVLTTFLNSNDGVPEDGA